MAKQKEQGKYRGSLKRQMAGVYILLMSLTLVACWFFNDTFLERSYLRYKRERLIEIYDLLSETEDFGTGFFDDNILQLCVNDNVSFVVTDSSSNTLYSNIKDPAQISRQLRDIVFSRDQMDKELIVENDAYSISYLRDPGNNSEYVVMWGNLDVDCFFMMRSPLESVRESVRMANRMLLIIGGVALLFAAVIIWFVTRKVTGPILDLADVSKSMAELDFERKYEGTSKNEIGVLGENMNRLSARLERTISDLKTANLELQKDVEARRNADERRAEFLANVSHELKTPIALIQGYAEGLKDGVTADPESREYYCDVIMDETRKMNHLVKRLISLNQVESGEDAMVMERFDLNELIRHCVDSFAHMCEQKQITLHYEESPGLYVWADEYQVEEVLRNYLSNAVHYCAGRMEIHVRATRENMCVRTGVFNSGQPIPEESVGRVWDKFYKVDKARTREYGGSGLGLSIVKAIMESMHQNYGVVNYDDGVEFWFVLETK